MVGKKCLKIKMLVMNVEARTVLKVSLLQLNCDLKRANDRDGIYWFQKLIPFYRFKGFIGFDLSLKRHAKREDNVFYDPREAS